MSPLTIAANIPNNCRLSCSIWVVATELMVANLMMIFYMRGAYFTPSNAYSFR